MSNSQNQQGSSLEQIWNEIREHNLESFVAELDSKGFTVVPPELACPNDLAGRLLKACLDVAERRNGERPDLELGTTHAGFKGHYDGLTGTVDSPFGDLSPLNKKFDYVFQSPGPIYEPGSKGKDWWRIGRFLYALGIGKNDILQNCFSYHFTPAGAMLESGAFALGASVFPAGTGNTEQQATAAASLGTTAYCGTPDYLLTILKKAKEMELDLSKLTKAAVSGGPLFPELRTEYQELGIRCLQAYATAELGLIAYETKPDEPMIVDEDVIVEIVTPGTGNPVKPGEVGEVLVTLLRSDFPLFRFATGDLSMIVEGESSCGRTNTRIAGWKGRADQATKVRGMFVRPEQVAKFQMKHAYLGTSFMSGPCLGQNFLISSK